VGYSVIDHLLTSRVGLFSTQLVEIIVYVKIVNYDAGH